MDWKLAVMLPPLIVWSALMGYLFWVERRVRQVEREMKQLLSGTMDSQNAER